MTLRSSAVTDIGRVRRQNEDRFLRDDTLHAYGVADGVGGLPGGAEAAERTVNQILALLARTPPRKATDLATMVQTVNQTISEFGEQLNPGVGVGTTLTFGCFLPKRLLLAHIGDSRCYRVRGDKIEMLTEDHSVENEARQRRARGEPSEYSERYRHALTRCVGQHSRPLADASEHALEAGDHYLFATDGITRVLPEQELASIISQSDPLEARLAALVERANERGGPDNVTAVLVAIDSMN